MPRMEREVRTVGGVVWGAGVALVLAGALAAAPAEAARDRTGSQLEFGVQMAKRGLWNEALFRFNRVLEERPGDARLLNNMAVAYEAIGKFDKALEYYRKALKADQGNRELRKNYAQFVEFYESLKPTEAAEDGEDAAAEVAASEPAGADDG